MAEIAGAVMETAYGELASQVKKVLTEIRQFLPHLRQIESTLRRIEPIIQEWEEKRLDRRSEEMHPLLELFPEGSKLVERCRRIHRFNVYRKYTHAKELRKFDAKMAREFQVFIPLERDDKWGASVGGERVEGRSETLDGLCSRERH